MAQKKGVNAGANLDFEQLRNTSIDEVRAKIVSLGADYHPAEKKPDLMARLLQLQGTAQPIDKIKKQLAENGISEDGAKITDTIPKLNHRLTPEELKKAAQKFIAKGMQLLISKDGITWEIRHEGEQLFANNRIVKAKRKDSGNTMIPLSVFVGKCRDLTTWAEIRRKDEGDTVPEDYEDLGDSADAAA